ncbi:MAG: outer membrane lipoprotein carrier protein LolA [Deltaproteobacteria bacterium]|nr:outer membrane lipoprotein carrier protein LolA [Deltaproteobacteria bacterium]
MHCLKKYCFVISVLLSCVVLLGWADSWEGIQKESAKIKSVKAQFIQSKHMKILARPLISKGRFYFQSPDSVRWEYVSPVKSVLLMNGDGIRRYTQGSRGLTEDKTGSLQSMQVVLKEIGQWSNGQFTTNEHFTAVLKKGKEPMIIMTPREKGLSAMISRIVITLSSDRPGILKSVKIFENEGNYTLFEFNDVQVNEKIAESLFRDA